jgi:uncharacterized membrane protein (DUF441 family)
VASACSPKGFVLATFFITYLQDNLLVLRVDSQDLDLICAPLVMTAERDDVIDFIIPYIEQTGISIGLMMHTYIFRSVA